VGLRNGSLTLDQFKSATSPDAVQRWLAATQLPGTLGAARFPSSAARRHRASGASAPLIAQKAVLHCSATSQRCVCAARRQLRRSGSPAPAVLTW